MELLLNALKPMKQVGKLSIFDEQDDEVFLGVSARPTTAGSARSVRFSDEVEVKEVASAMRERLGYDEGKRVSHQLVLV